MATREAKVVRRLSPHKAQELAKGIHKVIVCQRGYIESTMTAEQLAKRLGTNRHYLSEAVKTAFGMNFSAYVNEQRVKAAMRLLASGNADNLSMDDVGIQVGFANRQSFYSAFHHFVAMPPAEYRQKAHDPHFSFLLRTF